MNETIDKINAVLKDKKVAKGVKQKIKLCQKELACKPG